MFKVSLSRFVQSHARNGMSLSFRNQVKLGMSNQPNVLAGALQNQDQFPITPLSTSDRIWINRLNGYFEAMRSKKEYDNVVEAKEDVDIFKPIYAGLYGRVLEDHHVLPEILPFPVKCCRLVDLIRLNSIQNTSAPKNVDLMGLSKNVDLIIDIMSDLVHKIGSFHRLGAVFYHLDPESVLVAENKCKLATASNDDEECNSTGWKAPEQLLYNGLTKASNMFSSGCILYYCITGGFHPFGDTSEQCIRNMKANKMDISRVINDEAYNLISLLLSPEPELRPKANEVLSHPFFWELTRKVRFLRTLHMTTDEDRILIDELESKVPLLMDQDWCKKLNDYFDALHAFDKPAPKEIPEDVFGRHGSPTFLLSIMMRAYEIAIKLYDDEEDGLLKCYKFPEHRFTCLDKCVLCTFNSQHCAQG